MTTSATGGYLQPSSTQGAHGVTFEDFMQAYFVGLSGLPGALVRPRFQPKPPQVPLATVDWLACGITRVVKDHSGYAEHDPTGEGSHALERHEQVDFLLTFYGPNRHTIASLVEDNIQIRQNREPLQLNGIAFLECGGQTEAADLVNEEYRLRADIPISFRRLVKRVYPILNLLSVQGAFVTDDGNPPQPFIVEN